MTAIKNRPLSAWLVGIGIIIAAWAPGLHAQWKIMPIGDSITDGVGSTGAGYRSQLYDKLQGVNFSLVGPNGAAPYNGHFTRGAKIEEFYTGGYGTGIRDIASSMNTYQPDIILIHLGTNNMNNDDAAPYSENAGISMLPTSSGKLAQLLAYASQWANGTRGDFLKRIIVCKIVPRLVNGSPDPKIAD
ncbi:MAG TPA: GDSL-type esterase/lipase family protein, partial [bacterium]|nr:GDSL-type esterase/lipase family protein [bacterium]